MQLDLAIEGRCMDPHNQMFHFREMKAMEANLNRQIASVEHILIVEKETEDADVRGMEEAVPMEWRASGVGSVRWRKFLSSCPFHYLFVDADVALMPCTVRI